MLKRVALPNAELDALFADFIPPVIGEPIRGRPAKAVRGKGEERRHTPHPEGKERRKPAPSLRDPLDGFHPLGRVRFIGTQICPCCTQTTTYLAGDLLEYVQTDKVAGLHTIRTRAFAVSDSRFSHLPTRQDYLTPEHVTCPACFNASATYDAALAGKGQLPLALELPPPAEPTHIAEPGTVAKTKAKRQLVVPVGLLDGL